MTGAQGAAAVAVRRSSSCREYSKMKEEKEEEEKKKEVVRPSLAATANPLGNGLSLSIPFHSLFSEAARQKQGLRDVLEDSSRVPSPGLPNQTQTPAATQFSTRLNTNS